VIGFVDEGDFPFDPQLMAGGSDLAVHKIQALPDLLREEVVDEVIVACPRSMLGTIAPVVGTCAAVGVPVTVLSDLFGDMLPPPRSGRLGSHPALRFSVMHHGILQTRIKRAIDAVGAAVLLVLVAPILAAAAVAIRANSPGPILFRQQRCGLYGRRFTMLKLRTMHADAEMRRLEFAQLNEMDGPTFKIRCDPRTTPVGRFLRRYSLDEIPQLWNVLRGEMSLVGPRPPTPYEVDQYLVFQRRRLSMRPGLTCLWQVNGRNEIGFEEWVQLDLEYIDNWSLILDLRILLRTLPAVLRGTGAS
jgi:exopolysaccharide biosynthesis polyprenyl glycosylphosphotransferase